MWLNCSTTVVELEFESLDFRHRSRVFKTRDASFQNSFERMLTNYILSPHHANLQNPSQDLTEGSLFIYLHTLVFKLTKCMLYIHIPRATVRP